MAAAARPRRAVQRAGDARAEPDPAWLGSWRRRRRAGARRARRLAGPVRAEGARRAGAGAARRRARVGQLLDADPRRGGLLPQSPKPLRFLADRGANGIDGVVSSAAGAALGAGRPTWLLTGELALLHDVGGLLARAAAGVELQIVCLNNGGGGIFDFLPVAEHADAAALRGAHRHPARAWTWRSWRALGGLEIDWRPAQPSRRTAWRAPGAGGGATESCRRTWTCTRRW